MNHVSSPAIVLRRREYGDFDLILTVLTPAHGICTLIAKSAKKSTRRFPGILEPFAGLQVVYRSGKGMPVLEEASLENAYGVFRSDILKTAYASYWSELIVLWLEAGHARPEVYELLSFVLDALAQDAAPGPMLSLLFQMRFIGLEGLRPVLERCACCREGIEHLAQQQFCIDLGRGGITCHACTDMETRLRLGKGTLKQLMWMAEGSPARALRVRFNAWAMTEATDFLEAFVPYHIGKTPKSLGFLRQVRNQTRPQGQP
jgi:DNA repair protein RecO (recombination protein O)